MGRGCVDRQLDRQNPMARVGTEGEKKEKSENRDDSGQVEVPVPFSVCASVK